MTTNNDKAILDQLSPAFRTLIETASFDWQVSQHLYFLGKVHEHSANEIKAAAIRIIALQQHGDVFDSTVNYHNRVAP